MIAIQITQKYTFSVVHGETTSSHFLTNGCFHSCHHIQQEAEVTPHGDGTATCDWFLNSGADVCLGKLTAHWKLLEDEGYFLTSASVEPK